MDVQGDIVDRFGGDTQYLSRLASAIEAARGAGISVIYVTVAFRPGYPEANARNKTFSRVTGTGRFVEGSDSTRVHPAFPRQAEVVTIGEWTTRQS